MYMSMFFKRLIFKQKLFKLQAQDHLHLIHTYIKCSISFFKLLYSHMKDKVKNITNCYHQKNTYLGIFVLKTKFQFLSPAKDQVSF